MNTKTLVVALVVAGVGLGAVGVALGSGDDDDDDRGLLRRWAEGMKPGSQAVESQVYIEDCGSCHFPYQPGLLPVRSWEKVLSGLADHFGENAELPAKRLDEVRDYLLDNAAGRVSYGLSNKIVSTLGEDKAPIRITETPWFLHEHDEVPAKAVADNPEVKSFSRCEVCHARALSGSFDEHEIRIPGFSRWDD